MKNFKTAEEEAKFWLELARSKFWEEIREILEDRKREIYSLLRDPKIEKTDETRLVGRLLELEWLKDLPTELLNTVDMTKLLPSEEEEVFNQVRNVGKPDGSTGIL